MRESRKDLLLLVQQKLDDLNRPNNNNLMSGRRGSSSSSNLRAKNNTSCTSLLSTLLYVALMTHKLEDMKVMLRTECKFFIAINRYSFMCMICSLKSSLSFFLPLKIRIVMTNGNIYLIRSIHLNSMFKNVFYRINVSRLHIHERRSINNNL